MFGYSQGNECWSLSPHLCTCWKWPLSPSFLVVFCLFYYWDTISYRRCSALVSYVAELALNFPSFCLYLPSAGIMGMWFFLACSQLSVLFGKSVGSLEDTVTSYSLWINGSPAPMSFWGSHRASVVGHSFIRERNTIILWRYKKRAFSEMVALGLLSSHGFHWNLDRLPCTVWSPLI